MESINGCEEGIVMNINNIITENGVAAYTTQNALLLTNLLKFYEHNNNLDVMLQIINGHSKISLRIIDWFATNYAKKFFTVYAISNEYSKCARRFKVYVDYKLKLKAYSKKRFDPFCRWERITIPYKNGTFIQTTIGQLNFFKWAIENDIVQYIEQHYEVIENDMNTRNSTSKRSSNSSSSSSLSSISSLSSSESYSEDFETIVNEVKSEKNKTRKKREELSISAIKSIKTEKVEVVVSFE
jgi:hypothetical protein